MSALPIAPSLIAVAQLQEAHFEYMHGDCLAQVIAVENAVYEWPWSQGNIADSIKAGYLCLQLMGGPQDLIGYMIAMKGVDEVHLLNITVAPPYLGQGWARVMLDALALWAQEQNAHWLWLEARAGNTRALKVYEHYGFRRVGERKKYYPAAHNQREDAVVMNYAL